MADFNQIDSEGFTESTTKESEKKDRNIRFNKQPIIIQKQTRKPKKNNYIQSNQNITIRAQNNKKYHNKNYDSEFKKINTIQDFTNTGIQTDQIADCQLIELLQVIEVLEKQQKQNQKKFRLCKKTDLNQNQQNSGQNNSKEVQTSYRQYYKTLKDRYLEYVQQQKQVKIENKQIKENTLKELCRIVLLKKLDRDIKENLGQLQGRTDRVDIIKRSMIERVKYLIKKVYNNQDLNINVYGSLTTGLNLPNSDVDLQIKGLGNLSRIQIENKLKQLFQVLANFKWIKKSSQMILTSQIPIIKLDIDHRVDMYEEKEQQWMLGQNDGEYIENKEGWSMDEDCEIQIDISIDDEQLFNILFFQNNNIGQYSTQYIKEQLKEYECLRELTIFMKWVLSERQLNKSIDGGISSYCLIVMIIAFLKKNINNRSINNMQNYRCKLATLFYKLIDYYGHEFQANKCAINLRIDNDPFYQVEHSQNLLIIEPVSNQPTLGIQSFKFNEIQELFRKIVGRLDEEQKCIESGFRGLTNLEAKQLVEQDIEQIIQKYKQIGECEIITPMFK